MLCDMNRRTLILLLTIIVVIIALIVGYAFLRPPAETMSSGSPSPAISQQSPSSGESTTPASGSGSYVDYSPTAIAEAKGTTLLFFHASWCPSCRQIDSEITSNGLPDDVTIIKVDYDSHQDLRQKYGVTIQTTFVKVDSSGTELAKFVPYGGDLGLGLVLDELA